MDATVGRTAFGARLRELAAGVQQLPDRVLRRVGKVAPRLVGNAMARRGFRPLAARASEAEGTEAARLVERALAINAGERYLEIGIKNGSTLHAVDVATAVGVDPFHRANVSMCRPGMSIVPLTSDRYFRRVGSSARFDVVFVDGLHVFRQAYRDVLNAAAVLRPGGAILIDDVVPVSAAAAHPSMAVARALDPTSKAWMGDVYKVIIAIHRHHPELDCRVVADAGGHRLGLVWLRPGLRIGFAASEDELGAIDSLGFEDVFVTGSAHADLFAVIPEDDAFAAYAAARSKQD